MTAPSGSTWIVECRIGQNQHDFGPLVRRLEWKSLVNGGYIVRVKLEDPYFQLLDEIIEQSNGGLLQTGRQYDNPTLVRFTLKTNSPVDGGGYLQTKQRVALMADLHATGTAGFSGAFEFIAVDPISYYVNAGDCSGKTYRGKIGGKDGVIYQVLRKYIPETLPGGYSTKIIVDDTDDQENSYNMMRQDPKTFIASLLDWSSPFTKHKTSWMVANGQESGDTKELSIEVKESWVPSLDYPPPIPGDPGPFILNYGGVKAAGPVDILKWELLTDNFISAINLRLLTSGMSTISGEYWDKVTDAKKRKVYVGDDTTPNKTNPSIDGRQGFTAPKASDRGWTHIMSIPEVYSAGDIGAPYDRYIDGRARQTYMNMLNLLMRLRVTVRGQPRLYDSTNLGRCKVRLRWLKPNEEDGGTQARFLDGDWLLYGWHHKLLMDWETDLYLARLDWDAKSSVPRK